MGKKDVPAPAKIDEHWPDGDARTLAEAEVIKGDPKRYKAATAAAKKMAGDKADEALAMHRVATKRVDDSIRTMPFRSGPVGTRGGPRDATGPNPTCPKKGK
jgi:hypothetical protein